MSAAVTPELARPLSGLVDFELPPALEATRPPEADGRSRDDVRLLVAESSTGRLTHTAFRRLAEHVSPGDLIVINTSGTLPASLPALTNEGVELELHLSTPLPGGGYVVELRRLRPGGSSEPLLDAPPGLHLRLPGGGVADLLAPYPLRAIGGPVRLWASVLTLPEAVHPYLFRHGRPIRYSYVPRDWPLDAYQTVYATEPGSAEMPSAGRAFTAELITGLVAKGVGVAPLILHTGVSSPEAHEPPYAEPYQVPADTARRVNAVRELGGRVIAVGTTVVRALETVADDHGIVHPGAGWTEHVVTPAVGVRVVDGLLTGWHEPRASHLAMLEAVAGRPLLEASYRAALDAGYLWHEFGDLHLILSSARSSPTSSQAGPPPDHT